MPTSSASKFAGMDEGRRDDRPAKRDGISERPRRDLLEHICRVFGRARKRETMFQLRRAALPEAVADRQLERVRSAGECLVRSAACRLGREHRAAASEQIDFHGDVPTAGAIFGQTDHHQTEGLERLRQLQTADIERPKIKAL